MPLNMASVKEFFQNKYALAGTAVAVAAGGFVLYRKIKAGKANQDQTSSSGGLTTAVGGLYPAGSGIADTTASDIGAQLGYFGTSLQSTLTGYGQTITDALKGITPTPSGSTNTTGWALPGSPGYQPKPSSSVALQVPAAGFNAGTFWQGIVNKYFANGGHPTTNAAALEAWSRLHGGQTPAPGATVYLPTSSPGILN